MQKMRESVNTSSAGMAEVGQLVLGIAKHLAFLALGFLCADVQLIDGMSPLGVVLAVGVPYRYMFATGTGAFACYFIGTLFGGQFKYLAALTATVLIRFIIKNIKASQNAYAMMFTSFATVLMTNLVTTENSLAGVLKAVSEAVITAVFAFFVFSFFSYLERGQAFKGNEAIISFLFTLNICLLGLYPVQISLVSIGRILAMLTVLYAARFGKTGYGTICAVVVGISLWVSGNHDFSFIVAVAGLIAALSAPAGNLAVAGFFILSIAVGGALNQFHTSYLVLLTEAAAAALIFTVIPRNITAKIAVIFAPPVKLPELDGLRKSIVMRLGFAAASLNGVSRTVEDVGHKLTEKNSMTFDTVLQRVENEACRGCNMCTYCWERNKKDTIAALISMSEAVKHNRSISFEDMPVSFNEHCIRREKVENALYRNYRRFLNKRAAEIRVEEMRQIVADQFNGISDMLRDLEEEVGTSQSYDIAKADEIAGALRGIGISAEYCGCVTDKYGRITVEVKLSEPPQMPINRAKIMTAIAGVCGREMEPPAVNRVGEAFFVTVTEKARLAVDCGIAHINYKNNLVCGDTSESFYDGRGRFITVLSDGMGTGGRAAVDSAMASALMSRLLRSGFGYDCSLKIVNSAMMFRSTDESLATLDISCLDLFSGECELRKAGAGPTYALRSGRVGIARCNCLPIGILRDAAFDKATIQLKAGDILLMMSDGVMVEEDDWVTSELLAYTGQSAQKLAEHIAEMARRRRSDGHEDDITVVAIMVEHAV